MNVIILGASGMVGQGVLHECLADPAVQKVVSLSRNSLADQHPKLVQLVQPNLFDLTHLEG